MNLDAYLEPVSDDDPAGPDSFDLAERGEVQDMLDKSDDEVAGAEWPSVITKVRSMARQTRDIWVAVKLMEAGARAGSLPTIDEGGQLLAGLVEQYWDVVHPKLEDYDFEGRANTCASLTKIRDFLGPLRRTTLFETRLGKFSGEDLERFALEGDAAEGYGMFRAALEQMRAQGQLEDTAQGIIDQLDSVRESVRRTDAVLTGNAGSETSTNFQPTYEAVEQLRKLLSPYAGIAGDDAEADAGSSTGGEQAGDPVARGATTGAGARIGGRVETRDDVIKALDAIGDYYRVREPASPVPVLLKRVRQWVTMDFMAVLADLVPGSVDDARNVLVSKADQREEDNSGY